MTWTTIKHGDYAGKTLPQILFIDPDWFFYCMEKHAFTGSADLAWEAKYLNERARSIRIPSEGDLEVEYDIHPNTKSFCGFWVVPRSNDAIGHVRALRRNVIDMSIPHRMKRKDTVGNKLFISRLKEVIFGNTDIRMTKRRCEEFFDENKNFL